MDSGGVATDHFAYNAVGHTTALTNATGGVTHATAYEAFGNLVAEEGASGVISDNAVTFAVFLGVVWEIFEFATDKVAPSLNMQSNETGVDDTMHDLIVDTAGAIIVAGMGWAYIKTGRYSFIADAVRGFVDRNPRLFPRARRGAGATPDPGRGRARRNTRTWRFSGKRTGRRGRNALFQRVRRKIPGFPPRPPPSLQTSPHAQVRRVSGRYRWWKRSYPKVAHEPAERSDRPPARARAPGGATGAGHQY